MVATTCPDNSAPKAAAEDDTTKKQHRNPVILMVSQISARLRKPASQPHGTTSAFDFIGGAGAFAPFLEFVIFKRILNSLPTINTSPTAYLLHPDNAAIYRAASNAGHLSDRSRAKEQETLP
jgi:hypothetical protein